MATPTVSDVCNLALARCRSKRFIESLNEQSTEADLFNVFWDRRRRALLQFAQFEWAIKREDLNPAPDDPPDPWAYAYTLPTDCLRPLNIVNGEAIETYENLIPFRVEQAASGIALFTDQEDACLRFIYDHETVAEWSEAFVEALAADLAFHVARPLGLDSRDQEQLRQEARLALAGAAASSASNIVTGELPDAGHIRARL